ncbi:Hypothetical protein A7982_01611 [Minicystis rosea]|nr:Hypothetical protein A7982_01611 [Minicystis rosea]
MHSRLVSASALSLTLASLATACSSTPPPGSHYEEYTCPAPIGQIVREDCSAVGARFESMSSDGPSTGSPEKDQVVREANNVIGSLKEQRVSLCNDFNTCKLTLEQYRNDKQRIESSITTAVALKGSAATLDRAGLAQLADQLRGLRDGKPGAAPPTPPPPPPAPAHQAHAPTPPPPAPAAPPSSGALDSWAPGKFMLQAVGNVADAAKKIESKTNYGFDVDHACLLGAYLKTGSNIDIVQSFKAGRQYVLIGGGSENAIDVDLGVIEGSTLLASDTDDDPTPVVKFRPARDGNYTIRLALEKSKSSGNFVALAIMHEGGYSIPTKSIVASIGRAIRNATAAAKKIDSKGGSLVFHEQGNWSFYGTVLKPQEISSFGGLALVTDPTLALAGADDDGQNIDLFIKDRGGNVVAKDDEPDATPAVLIHPTPGNHYSLSVANAARQGTTLATVLLLDAKR